jgi:hypothetical protein
MQVSVQKSAVEQCIFIYNSYVKNDSACVCCTEFQQKFCGDDMPAKSTIHYLVNKLKTKGSLLDKEIKRRHHI